MATQRACQLFWDIACLVRPYPTEIIEIAIDKLVSLLLHQDRQAKIEFINMSYERLESQQTSSLQCIRIIQKLLDSIPKDKVGNLTSGSEIATSLIEQYHLIGIVIFDLSAYIDRVNTEWDKGTIHPENIDSVEMLGLPFTHRSNIAARLAFIRQLLSFSGTQLKGEEGEEG